MSSIRLQGVSKVFQPAQGPARIALHPLDLCVAAGELLTLVGPSGSGKTTVLRLIAGLEEPTAGQVFLNERPGRDLALAQRDVALVFQHDALYPHLNVRENLSFGLSIRKVPAGEIESKVRELAGQLELTPLLDRAPAELSGGQRQRVALGRALIRQPQILLLDEPLTHLDSLARAEMRAEIARMHRHLGMTTVLVTHDLRDVLALGGRVGLMQEGRLEQLGVLDELQNRPASEFVDRFVRASLA